MSTRRRPALKRRILVENPSTYLRFRHSTIPEWEFIGGGRRSAPAAAFCATSTIFMSAPAITAGTRRPISRRCRPAPIGEIHLAGHSRADARRRQHVAHRRSWLARIAEVWALYDEALARFGPVPTLIEWDNDVPPLDVLLDEAARAERRLADARRRLAMPTLLEMQRALRSLVDRDDARRRRHCWRGRVAAGPRSASTATPSSCGATKALRLSYPAVQRLTATIFLPVPRRDFIAAIAAAQRLS